MTASTAAEPQLRFERRGPNGRLGVITLNRPRQLNALSSTMIHGLSEQLAVWRDDDSIEQVLLVGAGERGLCAGGDIAEIARSLADDEHTAAGEFLAEEYRLDAAIGDFPKPLVPIMDGITFGGGIGLSGHAKHRVVTERSTLSMPETAIGFVPDVGGSWLLSRMPGELGTFAGLTGHRLTAGDALATGFADHYVPAERLPELIQRLEDEPADAVLAALAEPAPASDLLAEREWIDEAFAAPTVPEIEARLEALGETHPNAAAALERLRTMSPLATAATLELLRRNRVLSHVRAAIDLEYRVGMRLLAAPDFAEGVRALLIDKDGAPKWRPSTATEVTSDDVAELFDESGSALVGWDRGPHAVG